MADDNEEVPLTHQEKAVFGHDAKRHPKGHVIEQGIGAPVPEPAPEPAPPPEEHKHPRHPVQHPQHPQHRRK